MRPIVGLRSVEVLEGWPSAVPQARRLRGARAAGVAYERKFGRFLAKLFPAVESGRWIRFADQKGLGLAQPDHFVPLASGVILFECKLSETPQAWSQLAFYSELLASCFGLPVIEVQVCKHLTVTRDPVRDIRAVRHRSVMHWLP